MFWVNSFTRIAFSRRNHIANKTKYYMHKSCCWKNLKQKVDLCLQLQGKSPFFFKHSQLGLTTVCNGATTSGDLPSSMALPNSCYSSVSMMLFPLITIPSAPINRSAKPFPKFWLWILDPSTPQDGCLVKYWISHAPNSLLSLAQDDNVGLHSMCLTTFWFVQ